MFVLLHSQPHKTSPAESDFDGRFVQCGKDSLRKIWLLCCMVARWLSDMMIRVVNIYFTIQFLICQRSSVHVLQLRGPCPRHSSWAPRRMHEKFPSTMIQGCPRLTIRSESVKRSYGENWLVDEGRVEYTRPEVRSHIFEHEVRRWDLEAMASGWWSYEVR